MANIVTILISIAGLLTLATGLSLWLCFGRRKQYSPEKQEKKSKGELSDIEDGRCTCITCRVATKNDANSEPTLTTNVQSTSSVDPVIHIEAEKVVAEVKHHNIQPVRGLKNLRNTCYFNSTMQALVHTNSKFREELEILSTKGEFIEEVLKFFRAMQSDISRPYSPRKLHRIFGKISPRFANHEQHDSHECLRNFLDNIRKEEREILGAVDKQRVLTVVDSVFGGHFITVYICKDCGTPYHVFEALLDISLPTMIDEKALADMNSARISNQNQSMIDNASDFTVRHKSTGQSKSNTENSIAEIHPTAIFVHPVVKDKDDDAEKDAVVEDRTAVEYDKQNVSQVTVEEIKDTAEQEEEQAEHKGSKKNDDKEVEEDEEEKDNDEEEEEEEIKQANNEVKCTDTTVNEDEEENVFYDVREKVKHEHVERAEDHEVAAEVDDFEDVIQEDGDHYQEAIDRLMTPLSLSSPCLPNDETAMRKHVAVHDCLSYFTREEHITKEYLCNDCYGKNPPNEGEDPLHTSATKQTLIFNPPAILTLHLKRFELKPGRSVKRNNIITYEELLDIAPYCSSMCLRNDPPCQNIWYSLYGVVVHHGSTLKSGHYTAYVKIRDHESEAGFRKLLQKNFFDRDLTRGRLIEMMQENHRPSDMTRRPTCKQPSGTWYCMDDSSCRKVSVTTVLNQEAYLLFYERSL